MTQKLRATFFQSGGGRKLHQCSLFLWHMKMSKRVPTYVDDSDCQYGGQYWSLMDDLEHADSRWRSEERKMAIEICGPDFYLCLEWLLRRQKRKEKRQKWHARSLEKTQDIKRWLKDRQNLSGTWHLGKYWEED
jgi:hypothetical protein